MMETRLYIDLIYEMQLGIWNFKTEVLHVPTIAPQSNSSASA